MTLTSLKVQGCIVITIDMTCALVAALVGWVQVVDARAVRDGFSVAVSVDCEFKGQSKAGQQGPDREAGTGQQGQQGPGRTFKEVQSQCIEQHPTTAQVLCLSLSRSHYDTWT